MVNASILITVILLIVLSGLFSGLTLGLLGLNKTELERKIKLGNKKAAKVYQVRKKGNLLLCTLLLGNVAVNSALSIFLGTIASGIYAGIIATGLIVIFGEIIPQASISRYALEVGYKTVWLVKFFMIILFPVCWPIAKILDKMLGDEMPTIWSRHELEEIIKLHKNSPHSSIDANEEKIVLGALSFSEKTAEDILTPKRVVFALEENTILNRKKIEEIKKSGFTRIPVYKKEKDNIIGILYSKDLIGLKNEKKKVKNICKKKNLLTISAKKKLDSLLNQFIKRRLHIASVFNRYHEFIGIITLEDIIEEILKTEIIDENDKVINFQKAARRKI